MTVATGPATRIWASASDAESTVNFTTTKKMNEKEMLRNLFEFETYCTARFDSEARVAFAVYDYVQQMKRRYTSGLNPTHEQHMKGQTLTTNKEDE